MAKMDSGENYAGCRRSTDLTPRDMMAERDTPTALVLGGYGLIGAACCRALLASGFRVVGVGRSPLAAKRLPDEVDWIFRDLTTVDVDEWRTILDGVDVVVNAAGALQDGPEDDLEAIHVSLIERLTAAAPQHLRIIQISAAGVALDATTAFFETKARGDALLATTDLNWVILRPSLVLAPDAYGGTALLRGAAALPGILPKLWPSTQVQTVHIDDLANAVAFAARGSVPAGTIADISEASATYFPDLVLKVRLWLGLCAPLIQVALPQVVIRLVGRCADMLGRLGWRSPLRTTALTVLEDGICADPKTWEGLGGSPCRSFDATLQSLPSTRQERLFARLYFAVPFAIGVLSLFWIVSGLVALAFPSAAADYLADSRMSGLMVWTLVFGGAIADILLGIAILFRRWCRPAAMGMIALAVAYLIGGAIAAPTLWVDPLGPMVKVIPSIALALIVWLGVEKR